MKMIQMKEHGHLLNDMAMIAEIYTIEKLKIGSWGLGGEEKYPNTLIEEIGYVSEYKDTKDFQPSYEYLIGFLGQRYLFNKKCLLAILKGKIWMRVLNNPYFWDKTIPQVSFFKTVLFSFLNWLIFIISIPFKILFFGVFSLGFLDLPIKQLSPFKYSKAYRQLKKLIKSQPEKSIYVVFRYPTAKEAQDLYKFGMGEFRNHAEKWAITNFGTDEEKNAWYAENRGDY